MKDFCAYFNGNICKSCTLLPGKYLDQIAQKETILLNHLSPLGLKKLLPTVSSQIDKFRNKAKLVVTGTLEQPVIGLSGENNLDEGREILDCPIHHPKINEVILELRDFIKVSRLEPYRIKERKGELKGIIIFYSETSDEMYLRLIVRSRECLDRVKKFTPQLMERFPFITCITLNIQPIPHALLEGEEEIFLTGRKSIIHQLGLYKMNIAPRGFVQTNQRIAEKLYTTAAEWVKSLSKSSFSELFCGQGAFSLFVGPYVKESLGIEINPEAIIEANRTAQESGLQHLKFKCADAGSVLNDLLEFNPEIVLVNPPRKGLGKSLEIFDQFMPEYIVYSSCSHETLATDIQALSKNYEPEKAQIFDMFPHTNHFETLVLLKRI